ncbi:FtsQ-type POTRA domain-containing protein [candidate division WOR-3 bacterium]|nr:FtsQ-type POTRA domain-containing protein [candidate division WOR-3 bacterium]
MKTATTRNFKFISALLVVGALFSAGIAAGKLDFFRIKYVVVEGNTEFSSDEILSLSGVSLGDCVFFIDIRSAENELSRKVFAEDIQIIKHGFNTLRIEIIERRPTISIGEGRGVDSDGYILPMDTTFACLKAETFFEYGQTENKLRGEDRILKEVAEICSRDVDFSFLSEVVVERKGLSVITEDGIYVYIGNSDLLTCLRIIMTLNGTEWWDSGYCYDLSSPGELLISRKSFYGNNKDCYGG